MTFELILFDNAFQSPPIDSLQIVIRICDKPHALRWTYVVQTVCTFVTGNKTFLAECEPAPEDKHSSLVNVMLLLLSIHVVVVVVVVCCCCFYNKI